MGLIAHTSQRGEKKMKRLISYLADHGKETVLVIGISCIVLTAFILAVAFI
jgi:glycosyltransferase A (GT-A) superfamily protein (DUF2064 family)